MRLLGVLGGMSWTSTETYYRLLNTGVAERLGRTPLGAARAPQRRLRRDRRPAARGRLGRDRRRSWATPRAGLAAAGAEGLLLATNTMHKVADAVEDASGLEVLHIADATAAAVRAQGLTPGGAARHGVHDGGHVLRRPAGAARASRRSCPTRPAGPRCTGSSTTSWCATSYGRSRGSATAG